VIDIIEAGAAHDAEWNAFVAASPQAAFYHRAEWRRINEACFGHRTAYLAARQDGRIVGVLPLVQVKSLLFGNIACSLPFVNYGGPCGESEEIERQLMLKAEAVTDDWRVDYVEIRSRRHLGERYPASEHKVSMTIELDADPERLWTAFKSQHRNDIRRAQKHGFVAKFGPDLLKDFYQVLSETWRDMGTPIYSMSYLKAIQDAFGDATRICVVYDAQGEPAAAAFDGLHNGIVEGMWLGARAAYRKQMVGYVLYWELIQNACTTGSRRFHLGRSSADSGGEQFKKKWNAASEPLFWHYMLKQRAQLPRLNVDNPRYRLAIRTWQKLPLPVTQVIGPRIARSIP
jgi:FemAB-related protein (PEP-CTERM system-associated)